MPVPSGCRAGASARFRDAPWAANKRFEILKFKNFKFKFPIARTFALFRARSRLYRIQSLQVNIRWKALAEIYTTDPVLQLPYLKFFYQKLAENSSYVPKWLLNVGEIF